MNSGWWVAVSAVAIALSKAANVLPKDGACFGLGRDYVNGGPIETTRGVETVWQCHSYIMAPNVQLVQFLCSTLKLCLPFPNVLHTHIRYMLTFTSLMLFDLCPNWSVTLFSVALFQCLQELHLIHRMAIYSKPTLASY